MADDDFPARWNHTAFSKPDPSTAPDPAESAEIRRAGRDFSVSGESCPSLAGVAERSRCRPSKPRNGAWGKERSDGKPAFRISGCRHRRRNRVRRGGQGRPGAGGRRPGREGRRDRPGRECRGPVPERPAGGRGRGSRHGLRDGPFDPGRRVRGAGWPRAVAAGRAGRPRSRRAVR